MNRNCHTNERATGFPLANELLGANKSLLEGHGPILDTKCADISIPIEPLLILVSERY